MGVVCLFTGQFVKEDVMLDKCLIVLQRFFKAHHHDNNSFKKIVRPFSYKIGYRFRNEDILVQALKHRSYLAVSSEERLSSNERLELLGDAVLGLVVTEYLYKKFPSKEEGELTSIKSLIVSRNILAKIARRLNIGQFILMNEAEERAGGRERTSIVADALEAIIGAIYLDGGLKSAVKFVENYVLKNLGDILSEEQNRNFKSILLEYTQSQNLGLPIYSVRDEEGPDHNKVFTVEVKIKEQVWGIGKGNNKKRAEQMAAQNALKKLDLI